MVDPPSSRESGTAAQPAAQSLLTPKHPAWPTLNAEKEALKRPAADTPVAELLRRGQALSAQAAALRRALEGERSRRRSNAPSPESPASS